MVDYSTATHEAIPAPGIHVLGKYRPWGYHKQTRGPNSPWPENCGKLLDLKESRERGLIYFQKTLEEMIKQGSPIALAVVPSHDALKLRSGIHILASRVAAAKGVLDTTDLLIRTKTIQKLAAGGDRSMAVHLGSMAAHKIERLEGRQVLLLDDIMTTGNSLAAGRQVLIAAGAEEVACMALGLTIHD